MAKINKDFDGVLWEWTGRKPIKNLKPICPKCKYELDIIQTMSDMKVGKDDDLSIAFPSLGVLYSCPDCSFTIKTNIDNVNNPKTLRKAARKEFERRQRLMVRKTSKNNK